MSLLRTAAAALAALMVLTACGKQADGKQAKEPSWRVSDAHMNAMPPGQTRAAVYLKLENPAPRERMIQYVATPIAGTTEVHRHFHEDGMMKMRAVPHARVAAQSTLEFKPGGYHIMLLDVAEAPEVGSRFPLTFEFDGGERLEVEVEVRPR
mgnify:FL=1|jgi:copper(I)-binding protein